MTPKAGATIIDVLEGSMIIDGVRPKRIDTTMLMHLYRHYSYDCAKDVVDDGGKPRKVMVRITIEEETIVG